jgi:long-chain acyl-CoA synthetase
MATPTISQPELLRPPLDYPRIPYDRLLTETAQRSPENEAVVFRDVSLTYRELEASTNRFARALRALGVGKGDHVCLLTPNCPEFVIAFFALARLGAVASAMNPSYREREIEYQLGNAEAVALIAHRTMLPLVEAVRAKLPRLRHVIAVGAADAPAADGAPGAGAVAFADLVKREDATPPPAVAIGDDDLVALPYSSGTTGLPKGVMLSHRNLVVNNYQFVASLRVRPTDRLLLFLPLYHIYGTMLMGAGVVAGAALILMDRFDPAESLRLVKRHGVTLFFAVPPVLLVLSQRPDTTPEAFDTVRLVMVGAAPVAPELSRRFRELTGTRVLQGYGLTEAGPLTHLNVPYDDSLNVIDSCGLPAHDTEQKVVDLETGTRVLPPGEVGEICVRGPQVMQGYWKAPEATADALRDGWLHTGDIGWFDESGYTHIQDRKKEMIKYKGFGIAPAEIEALLLEHPGVADVAVIGKPDPEAGEVPKAFVVPKSPAVTIAELADFARGRLAGYKALHEIEFVQAIPKNPSGKILRRVLKEQEIAKAEAARARS